MKAFIISLSPDNETARNLQNALARDGVDAEIFPAVDGRFDFPQLLKGESINQHKALTNRKAELTKSEVGCYLSHLRAIKTAYNSGLQHVAIFEDDVIAEAHIGDVMGAIENLGEGAHLVRLMSLKLRKRKKIKTLTGTYLLTRPMRGGLGTQGYIANRRGMEIILKHGSEISMPIDKLYDSFFLYNLRCYNVEPHVIYEKTHLTTIKKTEGNISRNFEVILRWRLNKLYRSLRRHYYKFRHYSDFFPASTPQKDIGRSKRIRY